LQIYPIIALLGHFCNYESMLNYLHFKKLYSRRQNIDALFLINVFKNNTDSCSVMNIAGLHAPTKQTRDFSTFNVSNVSRISLSSRRVKDPNNICKSLDFFNKYNISQENTFPLFNPTGLYHYCDACTIILPRIIF
jgi:hypothetical protein